MVCEVGAEAAGGHLARLDGVDAGLVLRGERFNGEVLLISAEDEVLGEVVANGAGYGVDVGVIHIDGGHGCGGE